ncbi:thioester reductase domain-containing protein [Cylindrospermum sp. NIES-4074]|nr:thioester reductase domain-containing protein [Cylindrospermum sp. NIES-4074]
MVNIILTGATGLLGRNLLFEILKQNINHLDNLKIFTFIRCQEPNSLSKRIQDIIANDGCDYLGLTDSSCEKLTQCIIPIYYDLTQTQLGISLDDLCKLKAEKIDYFFHVAALTDLRKGALIEESCLAINLTGTKRILQLAESLNICEFVYVSTVYACGKITGLVEPGYINVDNKFRNPYEKSKVKAEILVKEYAKESRIKYKIFRTSVICGRLMEKRIGSVSKFDVLYGTGAFFVRQKLNRLKSVNELFSKTLEIPTRMQINYNAGLNIVPVDYAAKMIYGACLLDDNTINYHIANSKCTLHKLYISWMLEAINIVGYSFIEKEPKNKNQVEKFYYKTVGKIFMPYITSEHIEFKVDNLKKIEEKMNIKCPQINQENFLHLMNFAKDNYFGLDITQ